MQEEVTQKTIALSMKTGKLTAQALQAALKKYLQHRAKLNFIIAKGNTVKFSTAICISTSWKVKME